MISENRLPGAVAAALDHRARQHPDATMLIDGDERLSLAEVTELTLAGVSWLAERGVRPGQVVAWQLPTGLDSAILMLALSRANVIQAPIIHIYGPVEVAAAVDASNADVLVVDSSTARNAESAGVPVVVLPDGFVDVLRAVATASSAPDLLADDVDADAVRWIYFTSGTTGAPKAVKHSDSTVTAAASGFREHYGMGAHPDEVGSIPYPIAHIGGVIYLYASLLGEFPVVLMSTFKPDEVVEVLRANRVTLTGGSTIFYQLLLNLQLASGSTDPLLPDLRMLIGGGAPCPPELHRKIHQHMGIPVAHAYGMTESGMICVSHADDEPDVRAHSSGSPIPGMEVRVISRGEDGSKKEVPVGEIGEIEIRGSALTRGYVDETRWAQAHIDGWFETGDRGFVRHDGRVTLTGRTKDLIIRKGENISPVEIEAALLGHTDIDEAVVIGLPDELRGEIVTAVLRRSGGRELSLDDLREYLSTSGLMQRKWPELLIYVDSYPLTGLGKVAKTALVQQLAAQRQ